jgi:hypothetical protein
VVPCKRCTNMWCYVQFPRLCSVLLSEEQAEGAVAVLSGGRGILG